jgi:hypothetical protein
VKKERLHAVLPMLRHAVKMWMDDVARCRHELGPLSSLTVKSAGDRLGIAMLTDIASSNAKFGTADDENNFMAEFNAEGCSVDMHFGVWISSVALRFPKHTVSSGKETSVNSWQGNECQGNSANMDNRGKETNVNSFVG